MTKTWLHIRPNLYTQLSFYRMRFSYDTTSISDAKRPLAPTPYFASGIQVFQNGYEAHINWGPSIKYRLYLYSGKLAKKICNK